MNYRSLSTKKINISKDKRNKQLGFLTSREVTPKRQCLYLKVLKFFFNYTQITLARFKFNSCGNTYRYRFVYIQYCDRLDTLTLPSSEYKRTAVCSVCSLVAVFTVAINPSTVTHM